MFGRRKHMDVVIVGARPAGLFAALMLAKRGLRVEIVDKESRTAFGSCTIALHGEALQFLDEAGLLPGILEKAREVDRIGFYDRNGPQAEIHLAEHTNPVPSLVVMRQDILESLLEDALADCGVRVLWNHRVSEVILQPDKVLVTVDRLVQESMGYSISGSEWVVANSRTCEASFVVGADGFESFVRRAAKIEFPVVGDPQCYGICESRSGMNLDGEIQIVMGDHTTDALWPMADGFCRWNFELLASSSGENCGAKDHVKLSFGDNELPTLSEETCVALITERAPWFSRTAGETDLRVMVRFERRVARSFGRDRIGLVGDAAHLIGPVGMHSTNIGLLEARDLAEAIGDMLPLAETAKRMEMYYTRSLSRWHRLYAPENGFQCNETVLPWVRQRKDRFLQYLPASDDADIAGLAEQIGLRPSWSRSQKTEVSAS